jgi:hypothetical protein
MRSHSHSGKKSPHKCFFTGCRQCSGSFHGSIAVSGTYYHYSSNVLWLVYIHEINGKKFVGTTVGVRCEGKDLRGGVQTRHEGLVSDLFSDEAEIPSRVAKYGGLV